MKAGLACTLAAFLFLFFTQSAQAEDVKLRMKFNEGDQFKYKFVDKQQSEQMGMKTSQEQTQYMDQKVVSIENGVATVETVLTRVTVKGEQPMMGKIDFDTAEEAAEGEMAEELTFYKKLVGKPFKVKMNELGEIVGAVVTDELLDKIFGEFCIGK